MSIARDLGLIEKYNDISDALTMKIKISHDQVCEVVVADLMAKYKACCNRDDEYKEAFEKVLRFYLSKNEMKEMEEIINT